MKKDKIIAIIPARAGSKRLVNKNMLSFMGKPMIAWTIEAALKSAIFCDVLVATDSKDIADLAKSLGASAPFLRDKDVDDYTPVSEATLNALIKMEEYKNEKYETVAQLMANCPLRSKQDIIDAYNNFKSSKSNFQISVFKFGWMNPHWALKMDKTKQAIPLFPKALKKRSQDLEELFCPTGAIWIAKVEALKKEKTFYGKGYKIFPLGWENALDIDDASDFKMAEIVYKQYKGGK